MTAWSIDNVKIKTYPHFDAVLSREEAFELATDPQRVAAHAFYPFFRFSQGWTEFAKKGEKSERKDRELRFAARGDAYIYSRYRHLLSEKYEEALAVSGISDSVLAYRRLKDEINGRGKSNIEFARDAFNTISTLGECFVIALDISKFFESLDHARLKVMWSRMLGVSPLPPDHFAVFEAITKYAVVDRRAVFSRLGHFGPKGTDGRGRPKSGYLTPYKKMPRQLCSGAQFRQKIAGGDGSPSLIRKNRKPYGIPQGSPISDLLANMYLFDFDLEMRTLATSMGGMYYRYSDDILLVIQGDETKARWVAGYARAAISQHGPKLIIKESKSSVFEFRRAKHGQAFRLLDDAPGVQGRNGLEYLGFRFDGRQVYIRDKTLSGLWRKITAAAKRHAIAAVKRYPDKDLPALLKLFDYEAAIRTFGRVDDFKAHADEYESWTFWTYARRSSIRFGELGKPILKQLRDHRKFVKEKCAKALQEAHARKNR